MINIFTLNRETELTTEILAKMIESFNTNVSPKLNKYKNYYDGTQAILNKKYNDSTKPCNKVVTNFCQDIADSYCGYLAAPSFISYQSNDDIEEIMNVLKYNDYQTEDSDFLSDALVYGVAAELMYMDGTQVRFRLINPTSCFGVYDDSLTGDLLYFVRFSKASEWNDSEEILVDVYSDFGIKHYLGSESSSDLKFIGEEPHYFSQCPANIFYLPDEKSIFDKILTLQDAYNELTSSELDDYSAFCDAYLALLGADIDAEDIASMKENRVLVLPEGASAQWLTKQVNDAQVENLSKRLQASIYRIGKCPDFSSESFVGGVSSGIAIQYRLTGMEGKAAIIEGRMKKALQRRIEIICGIASLTLGEEVFRDIKITFKRNIPVDEQATINKINSLKGTVSDATLLAQLPFIADVNAELEAVQEQKLKNMEVFSFGESKVEDEGEEDDE